MTSKDLQSDLLELLSEMDIPLLRRELTKSSVRWLLRNVRIRNSDHPKLDEVIDALKILVQPNLKKDCPNPGCHCGACK